MLFSLILFFVFRSFDLNLIDALTNVNNLDGYTDDCGSHTRSNDSIQFRHTENCVASNVFVLDRIGEWILAWWILLLCYFFCILYCWLLPSPSHKPSINCDSLLYSFLFISDSSAKWINTLKCKITRITEMIFYLLLDYTFCFLSLHWLAKFSRSWYTLTILFTHSSAVSAIECGQLYAIKFQWVYNSI